MKSRSWTFGSKISLGFGISVLVLLAVCAVSFRITDSLIENDRSVEHTHAVIHDVKDLLSELKDAETGQRGYLLTGDDTYLEPYRSALTEIAKTSDELRTLTSDNPHQQQRLTELDGYVRVKLGELAKTIELRHGDGLVAALKLVESGDGKSAMDDIRRVLAAMESEERALLKQRSDAAEASARAAKSTIVGGAIAGFVFVLIAAFVITSALNRQLGAAVTSVQSSSVELQAAATQQASATKEQVSATTEVSTTLRELGATSRQIAESAQRVARIAEGTAESTHSGDQIVERAQAAIGTIKHQVDVIVSHMLDLGKKSQQVGGILDLINELAEQTNILSINASIESAGAGDAGHRFGVVADEIRKLADRVGGSTKEIRALIEEIRSAANTTVMATENGAKAVDAGTRQFGEVADAFKQIRGQVATTTDAAREIELSTRQQASGVDQVVSAVSGVAQAAKETELSARQTLETAGQLTNLARDLGSIVSSQAAA